MPLVSPSLLSADFGHLERDIKMLNDSQADWYHLDVMDGVFVPNISFGFPVMEAMAKAATKPLDVHLMIERPEKFIAQVAALGAKVMNVHYEACTHLHRVVTGIKEAGMMAGVTLNPHTPVELLTDIIGELDLVMLMSVNPGLAAKSSFIIFLKNQTPTPPHRRKRCNGFNRNRRWCQPNHRPMAR